MVGTSVATFCAGASVAAETARAAAAPEDARLARGDMFVAAVTGCVSSLSSNTRCETQAWHYHAILRCVAELRARANIISHRVLAVTIASELAAARADVKGSGTFLPALIDELGALTSEKLAAHAKVELV